MDNILDDLVNHNRRLFVKYGIRAGGMLALSPFLLSILHAAHDPYKQKPEEFTIENFDKWYKMNRLYKGINPNLRSPHENGLGGTFKGNPYSTYGATRGIDYNVSNGEIMVASAPGEVGEIKELNTGKAGGYMVMVLHRGLSKYRTYYAHLNKIYIRQFQQVKRGDPIGNVTEHRQYAKLLFGEGSGMCFDPDNYGENHSYMKYKSDMNENFKEFSEDEIIMKEQNQWNAYEQLNHHFKHHSKDSIKMHKKSGDEACEWSSFEYFKYLLALYEVKPDLFPELSEEKFQTLKKEFYDNQPIVLTLPFRKGGMGKF